MTFNYELIKFYRTKLYITQKQASKTANLNIRQWQKYESGEQEPTVGQLAKICISLNKNPNDFYI